MYRHRHPFRPAGRATRLAPVVVAVAVALAVAGCDSEADGEAPQSARPPPPPVSVAEVVVDDVAYWDSFTGHIEAVETVDLRSRVPGYIERINYREGQRVEAGDVLFVIDQRPYRAELARAEAELQRARARATLARADVERAEALARSRSIAREALDQRRAATAETEADILAAAATVETARLDLAFTEVRAPIAGRTGRALVTAGNLVSAATPLTTIVSLDRVHVHFFSDERTYLAYDAIGRADGSGGLRGTPWPVRVGLASDAGYPYTGALDFVDNALDTTAGTMRMRAVLDNGDGRFAPGMFARVQLRGGSAEDAILIDERAVLTDQDRKFVYIVDEQGLAQRRDVRLGREVDGLRVIESGLAPGDRVVVRGVQRIFFPGMPVTAERVAMRDPVGGAELTSAR